MSDPIAPVTPAASKPHKHAKALRYTLYVLIAAALVTGVLLFSSCAALVPGYTEERNGYIAERDAAKVEADKARTELTAALKSGDAEVQAAALEKFTATLNAQIEALNKLAQYEITSAGQAASTVGRIGTGDVISVLTAIVLGVFAESNRRKANAAATVAQAVATGPSRAKPELDEQWDKITALQTKIAAMEAKAATPPHA
jgi:hypothetical protein